MGERAFVEISRRGQACLVTLREEKLNALSTAVELQLAAALECPESLDARCIVFTGAGRAFSAGADLTELNQGSPGEILALRRRRS